MEDEWLFCGFFYRLLTRDACMTGCPDEDMDMDPVAHVSKWMCMRELRGCDDDDWEIELIK